MSIVSIGQIEGLFTRNIEKTLSDSVRSITIDQTGRVYKAKSNKIVERIDGNKSIRYEYFKNGHRITYSRNGNPYLQKVSIDSAKFYFFKYSYFDSDTTFFPYEKYMQVYQSIASSIDSSTLSRIHQITTTKKRDQPIIEIKFYNETRDTIYSSRGSMIAIDSMKDHTVEYTYLNKVGEIKSRERYVNGKITYSYTKFGDIETIIDYRMDGLISQFIMKPLVKDYYVKHYTFEYDENGKLIKEVDQLNSSEKTYSYSFHPPPR